MNDKVNTATINGPGAAATTSASTSAAPEVTKTKRKSPTKPPAALTFTSAMTFKDVVTDQEGKEVGTIKMTGKDTFEFVEIEGTNLTGAQHIAVGKRLAALEKAFGKLNLPS